MLQILFFTFWMFFLSLASTTLIPYLSFKGVMPDVFFVGGLCMCMLASEKIIFYLCFVLGLFYDVYTSHLLGTHSLLFLVLSLLIKKLKKEWLDKGYLGTLVFVFAVSIFYQYFLLFINFLQGEKIVLSIKFLFLNALYNLVFFNLVYFFWGWWVKSFVRKD